MHADIRALLRQAVSYRASDLHLTVGVPPLVRVDGSLTALDYPILSPSDIASMLAAVTSETQQRRFQERGELDFSYAEAGFSRFRVNAFRQRGSVAMVLRSIPEQVPSLTELGLPAVLQTLADMPRGLVLVTGPTGSGKSTTLAAMVDHINHHRACHIITLEDPIEYLHKHCRSIVNQREVGLDTASFATGLRAALREDPDVILVGEMRDAETIATAITAAETGHLVLSTLHTGDAAQTVERIIDVFPPHQQQQIRIQLALNLQGVVAQQLIPRCDRPGRVAAVEVLVVTPAVRNLVREGKTHQIAAVLQTGAKTGMQAMDAVLRNLWRSGVIAFEEALSRAVDRDTFLRLAQG